MEKLVVAIIVGFVFFLTLRGLWRICRGDESGCAGGCPGCSPDKKMSGCGEVKIDTDCGSSKTKDVQ